MLERCRLRAPAMNSSLYGPRPVPAPQDSILPNAIALGCRICVALSQVPAYLNLAGFDVRLHFHGSPSLWSSYLYGPGNGTLAVKEHGCYGGIACAHQPWFVPFMDRDPCQFVRTVTYPKGSCQANCVHTKLTH